MTSTQRDAALPDGVRADRCRRCGCPIWTARVSDAAARTLHYAEHVRVLLLEPHSAGGAVDIEDGMGVLTGSHSTGRFEIHDCPTRVVNCKYCGAPIRRLRRSPTVSGERLVVVDALADPAGTIAVDDDGYAVLDPDHSPPGQPRYRWHRAHGAAEQRYGSSRGPLTQR